MKTIMRKSLGTHFSMCVQPAFIIGTNNSDGSHNFAPITWVSVTNEKDNDYLLVISMFGTKMTKQNVRRTGKLSVNLVSTDMLELMDYFGTHHAADGKKEGIAYNSSPGVVVDVPVLDASRWVYECEVSQTVETGASTTFFCRILNVQVDEKIVTNDTFDIDLTKLEPVIYSGMYHSIGELLGKIGDFVQQLKTVLRVDDISGVYLDSVRYRHSEYVEPTKWKADLIMNGSSSSEFASFCIDLGKAW